MHIIFGNEQATAMKEKYVVLELDTFRFGPGGPEATAFAVVENIAIPELPLIENYSKLHTELMINYRKKDWNFCEQAIEQLSSKWNGELDSFYAELNQRISGFKETEPDNSWDHVIEKPALPA